MGVVSFIPKFKILYSVVILLVSRVFYMCVCVYLCVCEERVNISVLEFKIVYSVLGSLSLVF